MANLTRTPPSSPPAELNLTYFDTPHDKTLAASHGTNRFKGDDNFAFPSRSDLNVAEGNASSQLDQHLAALMLSTPTPRLGGPSSTFEDLSAREHLTDPYDGSTIGVLLPTQPDAAEHPLTSPRGASAPGARNLPRNEELWARLSRVLELQTDIARTHAEMESIGIGKGKVKVGEGKDKGKKAEEGSKTHGQLPTDPGTEESDVEGEGVEMDDEETERNRAREEEFAKLADQFERRKESIGEIMNKVRSIFSVHLYDADFALQLDDLSKALTEFHDLQEPELKLPPSRSESLAMSIYESTPPSMPRAPAPAWASSSTEIPSAVHLPGSLSRI